MNSRENALKLRVYKLEQERAVQKLTIDRLIADLEMTESAGCGFAWDLASDVFSDYDPVALFLIKTAHENWAEALAAGADYQEARKWLRDRLKADKSFRATAIEAAGKAPDAEIETPFGRWSIRLLAAT